jgi:hypothetical protein
MWSLKISENNFLFFAKYFSSFATAKPNQQTGWPDVFVKNRPRLFQNPPKSRPTTKKNFAKEIWWTLIWLF